MDMVRALQSAKSRDEPRRTAETHGARCGAACQRVGLHRTDGPAGADAKSQRESQSVDPLFGADRAGFALCPYRVASSVY